MDKQQKLGISNISQVLSSKNIKTYLGCMNIDCKRTREDFTFIKEKISDKLASLKAKVLSQASKFNFYQVKPNMFSSIYYVAYQDSWLHSKGDW